MITKFFIRKTAVCQYFLQYLATKQFHSFTVTNVHYINKTLINLHREISLGYDVL